MYNVQTLNKVKLSCLVIDCETCSFFPDGRKINLQTNFDEYVEFAQVKFIGAYSYQDDRYYFLNMTINSDREIAKRLLATHKTIVGFNSAEFDFPILKNNDLTDTDVWYTQVDCMHILGTSNVKNRGGFAYKNRGELMGYKFKNNKLRTMAEAMGLETQKGDIDYTIFEKNSWTKEELEEIQIYLKSDVMATKEMFDKLWEYWIPFVEMLDEKSVYDLSWIRLSIASLTYKCACNVMGVEPTYGEHRGKKEKMGGTVLKPTVEEAKDVWYIDYASLYPHILCMFNLFAEVDGDDINKPNIWHGNNVFKVKGYYDISEPHILSKHVMENLKERINLKKTSPDDPMIYAFKIFLNCFSKDTDVLMADNRIQNIKDCKIGELVYSINPKTLIAEKKKIKKVFEYNYTGEMHHYKGNYFDFNVTPNHRFLLVHKNRKQSPVFVESIDIQNKYTLPIHKPLNKYKKQINILNYINKDELLYSIKPLNKHGRTWLYENGLENIKKQYNCNDRNFVYSFNDIKHRLNSILKSKNSSIYLLNKKYKTSRKISVFYDNNTLSYLIGIYLAEGSTSIIRPRLYSNGNIRGTTYSISLSQSKSKNPIIYKKITDALDKCNLKYSGGKKAIKISGPIFYEFIVNNFGKLGYKSFNNKNMFDDLNIKKVFEGLIDGDGSKKHKLFTTKYDCLRDDFIELCMRLGYTLSLKNDGCWRIVYNNNPNSFRKANRSINEYNDKVYCVEVEDNNTLMAGRNKKFNWSGNSLYGVLRSLIFEKVGGKNGGWDTCWLGQQMHELTVEMMDSFGFDTLYGDTDGCMVRARPGTENTREYVLECLEQIVDIVQDNVPFPVDTFKIDIENHLDYIAFPHSMEKISFKSIDLDKDDVINNEIEEYVWVSLRKYYKDFTDKEILDILTELVLKNEDKPEDKINLKIKNRLITEWTGKKKNYLYICKEKDKESGELKDVIKLVGLPIKKDNATKLGITIYEDVLKSMILERKNAKFPKEQISEIINRYLAKPDVMQMISREYKVKPFITYAKEGQIQAQISKQYFNGEDGIIDLIKNNKIGKVGEGAKYCTVQEAIDSNLKSEDLDLEKLWNELDPFVIYVPKVKKEKAVKEKKSKKVANKKNILTKNYDEVTI
ncbi:MAG: hypothetical protein M0R03_16345 [Novosphingobium sp.]|nr:hypothetical protein [Novosphingobium sp.]